MKESRVLNTGRKLNGGRVASQEIGIGGCAKAEPAYIVVREAVRWHKSFVVLHLK